MSPVRLCYALHVMSPVVLELEEKLNLRYWAGGHQWEMVLWERVQRFSGTAVGLGLALGLEQCSLAGHYYPMQLRSCC